MTSLRHHAGHPAGVARPIRFSRGGLGALALGLAAFALAGCETAPPRPHILYTGDPVVDGNAELAAAPPKDRVLWDYRVAASALRLDRYDEAKRKLDDALLSIGGIIAKSDTAAQRARSLFQAENTKNFIGEPYERAMAYYYRGLLYWRDGEPDNARACFRSAQLVDSDAEAEGDRSDYVLLEYLDGLATVKLSGDGSDAFARAQKLSRRELPPYDPKANVLCFVEFGRGPKKYAGGEFGEQLHIMAEESRVRSAALTVGTETVHFAPWDNLTYQAQTRGGRVMDYVLGRKAVFKENAGTIGDVALVGAAVAADNIYKRDDREAARRREARNSKNGKDAKDGKEEKEPEKPEVKKNYDAENAAIGLAAIGLLSKMVAAAATPQADTRAWDNLPQYLSFAALRLPPGEHEAQLEFFDVAEHRIDALTRPVKIAVTDPERDTVVILSELKR
jgi:hypothetical protein